MIKGRQAERITRRETAGEAELAGVGGIVKGLSCRGKRSVFVSEAWGMSLLKDARRGVAS